MPFVNRGPEGDIVAASLYVTDECDEQLDHKDIDLVRFLEMFSGAPYELTHSDLDFVRVVEDLVDVLVTKNYLLFTDLPEKAQEKMRNRKTLRGNLNAHLDLLGDDEQGFF